MLKQVLFTSLLICLSLFTLLFGKQNFTSVSAASDDADAAHVKGGVNDCKTRVAPKLEAKTDVKEPRPSNLPTPLLNEVQAWTAAVDFWKLVERGERLAARIEVLAVKSNALEAWVCGQTKVCVSTRLLHEFQPEAQQAVIAHELGHLLIPRNYAGHPQLWEAQCDLFAVAFLRDEEQMKEMLLRLADECPTCRDREHPAPGARAALVERYAASALSRVLKFDEFRARSYAVQHVWQRHTVPHELQQLSFAIRNAFAVPQQRAELKTPISTSGFHGPSPKR